MHIFPLVAEVQQVIDNLRRDRGDLKLALLFNSVLNARTNWNLIVSSDWSDRLGTVDATKIIAYEVHRVLSEENRKAISRVTVLRTKDTFVRDVTQIYPEAEVNGGMPVNHLTAGQVSDGAGYIFSSHRSIAA
jgi:hypothetical protein